MFAEALTIKKNSLTVTKPVSTSSGSDKSLKESDNLPDSNVLTKKLSKTSNNPAKSPLI
jgi:hypothetical protein